MHLKISLSPGRADHETDYNMLFLKEIRSRSLHRLTMMPFSIVLKAVIV